MRKTLRNFVYAISILKRRCLGPLSGWRRLPVGNNAVHKRPPAASAIRRGSVLVYAPPKDAEQQASQHMAAAGGRSRGQVGLGYGFGFGGRGIAGGNACLTGCCPEWGGAGVVAGACGAFGWADCADCVGACAGALSEEAASGGCAEPVLYGDGCDAAQHDGGR